MGRECRTPKYDAMVCATHAEVVVSASDVIITSKSNGPYYVKGGFTR